jgi:hypothetical protein
VSRPLTALGRISTRERSLFRPGTAIQIWVHFPTLRAQ